MSLQSRTIEDSQSCKVAVVAIHGIADQQPRDTARSCANVLLSYRETGDDGCPGGRPYRATKERQLRLAVGEIPLNEDRREAEGVRRMTFQAREVLSDLEERAEPREDGERWYHALRERFDRLVLPGEDRVFETVRLESSREVSGRSCDVHIYEMYWADLSRLGDRIKGIFVGLFHLLFFMGTEGARTLGYARATLKRNGKHNIWWTAFGTVHAAATRLLVLGVPTLTFAFLGFLIFLLCLFGDALGGVDVVSILPAAIVALAVGALLYLPAQRLPAGFWMVSLGLAAGAGAGTWAVAARVWRAHALTIVAAALWVGFLALFIVVMVQYQKRIQGALLWAAGVSLVLSWLLVRELPFADTGALLGGVTDVVESGIRGLHWPLWSLFALLSLLASFFAFLAVRLTPKEERESASRAAWTANLSVNLSGAATLTITSALWASFPELLSYLPERFAVEPAQEAFEVLVLGALSFYLPILLALLASALLIGAWAILPAASSDAALTKMARILPSSGWLGQNLRSAYRFLRLSGEIIRLSVIVGMTVMAARYWFRGETIDQGGLKWIFAFGTVLLIAITGSRGPFRFLALGFRAALDLALDVANWLRLDPEDRTPAGRICSRYYSLLCYLANEKYDAIVIFAHSQGTVITADLLRFINREWNGDIPPGLETWKNGALPVYLFTMGSPLRQIYARRFPYRYGWAEDRRPGHGWAESEACKPSELNVRFWSNAYRSGDYGGRYLWHPDDPDSETPWQIATRTDTDRREICLGPGGHTRYWDGSAWEVAAELDGLIRSAIEYRCPPSPPTEQELEAPMGVGA